MMFGAPVLSACLILVGLLGPTLALPATRTPEALARRFANKGVRPDLAGSLTTRYVEF